LAYIQDLRLIKGIYKEAIKSKESLIRLSGLFIWGYPERIPNKILNRGEMKNEK